MLPFHAYRLLLFVKECRFTFYSRMLPTFCFVWCTWPLSFPLHDYSLIAFLWQSTCTVYMLKLKKLLLSWGCSTINHTSYRASLKYTNSYLMLWGHTSKFWQTLLIIRDTFVLLFSTSYSVGCGPLDEQIKLSNCACKIKYGCSSLSARFAE